MKQIFHQLNIVYSFFLVNAPTCSICSEAVAGRCSVKKLFSEISQNSQENICARVPFLKTSGQMVLDLDFLGQVFFSTSVLGQVRFFFWDKYFREKWFSLGSPDKCFLGTMVCWRHFSLVLVQVQALATELQNTLRKKNQHANFDSRYDSKNISLKYLVSLVISESLLKHDKKFLNIFICKTASLLKIEIHFFSQ